MTTVLIVDDNREMRELVSRIVRKVSAAIFECEDGDEVLAAFALQHPDWVLMDVEMKRMDGLTATAALTRAHPEANVVIVTKYTDDETRQAALEAGARHFLAKDDLIRLRSLIV
jgi:CheY-like chemotaxis protein